MPHDEVVAFDGNLGYARQLCDMAVALEAQTTSAVDVTDVFRAALVHGVSAFDHFVHEDVRSRMVLLTNVPSKKWPSRFRSFRVSMLAFGEAATATNASWFEDEVRTQHGHLSFQQPDKVAEAYRLVSDRPLWPAVAAQLGTTVPAVKTRLKLIVDRRNRIAHEADMDPTPPKSRYAIHSADVQGALGVLEGIVHAVDESL